MPSLMKISSPEIDGTHSSISCAGSFLARCQRYGRQIIILGMSCMGYCCLLNNYYVLHTLQTVRSIIIPHT